MCNSSLTSIELDSGLRTALHTEMLLSSSTVHVRHLQSSITGGSSGTSYEVGDEGTTTPTKHRGQLAYFAASILYECVSASKGQYVISMSPLLRPSASQSGPRGRVRVTCYRSTSGSEVLTPTSYMFLVFVSAKRGQNRRKSRVKGLLYSQARK